MIGKIVTFIRVKWRSDERGVENNLEYTGLVLDKFTSVQRYEGKWYREDFYLVELQDGIIGKFFCDEAVRIIPQKNELSQ